MEWSQKFPFQWDWDHHGLLTGKEGEIAMTKATQSSTPIRNGSIYSSDLGNCSSRSSISASIDSSLKAGAKISGFNLAAVEASPKALNKDKEIERVEDINTSKEPLIGLKLGKRTYFEDVCGGSNTKISTSESSKVPSSALAKKARVSHQNGMNSQCQVEGCGIDLSGAKDYHRKHRVCGSHSRCPMVIIGGQERRFCQQCSRFHDLSEFDQKKRSCRRRLSDHNARRRKPQTNTISFNSSRFSSPFYDDRQQMNFLLHRAPFANMRPAASSTWEDSCSFSVTNSKGSWIKSTRPGMDSLNFSNSGLSNTVPATPHDLDKLLVFKGTTAEALSQGLEASVPASNLDGAPDFRRALSLLSNDTWGSSLNPGQSTLAHLVNMGTNNEPHPSMHAVNSSPVGYWQDQQTLPQQARALPFGLHDNGSQYETSFFDSGQLLSKSDGHFREI